MPSILSGLDTVQQALAAQQFALSITQRNIANANNPQYTRQEIVYTGDAMEWIRSGVAGISVQATRDRFLDYGVSQELQYLAQYSVASGALQQIDAILTGSGEGLQQALSNFFNSFASLSSTPEDLVLRQNVLSAAETLGREFRRLYDSIQQVQISQDRALDAAVGEVNALTSQIAVLNAKIREAAGARAEEEFALRDSRQQLLEQLSGLVDLSYFETESGTITVTTRQGGVLVSEDRSFPMELAPSAEGTFRSIFLDGAEITGSIQSGQLGGLIDLRDNKIAGYLNSLDELAATIIARVNEQHRLGADLDGGDGTDLFVPYSQPEPGSTAGAARAMMVALTDPRQVAAAGSGMAAGNNANARLLAAIGDEKLFLSAGATAGQFYASLIFRIGTDERAADAGAAAQEGILDRLRNQRDAFSGVNLDEEAVNIIKYQKAYQACARYARVLDDLSDDILRLLGA